MGTVRFIDNELIDGCRGHASDSYKVYTVYTVYIPIFMDKRIINIDLYHKYSV